MDELFDYVESLAFSAYANFAKSLDHMFDILESDPIFLSFLACEHDVETQIVKRIQRFEDYPECPDFNPFDPQLTFYLRVLSKRQSEETKNTALYVSRLRCSRFSRLFAKEILGEKVQL